MPRKKKQRTAEAPDAQASATRPAATCDDHQAKDIADITADTPDDVTKVDFDDVSVRTPRGAERQRRSREARHIDAADGGDAPHPSSTPATPATDKPRVRRTHRSSSDADISASQSERRREQRRRRRAAQRLEAHDGTPRAGRFDGADGRRRETDAQEPDGGWRKRRHVVQDRHHYEHRIERRDSLSVPMDAALSAALRDVPEVHVGACTVSVGHLYNIEMTVDGDPSDLATAMRVRELASKLDSGDSSLSADEMSDAIALTRSVRMTNMNAVVMRVALLPVGDAELMASNGITLPGRLDPSQAFVLTFLGFDGVLYERVSTVVAASELEASVATLDRIDEVIERYDRSVRDVASAENRLEQLKATMRRVEEWIENARVRQTGLLADLADVIGVSPMPACNRALHTTLNAYLSRVIEEEAERRRVEDEARDAARKESGGRGRRTRRHTTKGRLEVASASVMCMSTGDSSGEISCDMTVTFSRGGIVNGKPAGDKTVRGFCVIRLDGIDRTPEAYAEAARRIIAGDASFMTVVSGNGEAFTGSRNGNDDADGDGERKFLDAFVDAVLGNEVRRRGGK